MARIDHSRVEDFLDQAEKYYVPKELIAAAYVTYFDGEDIYLDAEDAVELMVDGNFEDKGIESFRIVIDMAKARDIVIELADQICNSIR